MVSQLPKPPITLASRSPQRRDLLERAGFPVWVVEPEVEEAAGDGALSPACHVHQNAWLKAQAGARRAATPLVVAADTVACVEGEILGKPRDRFDARRMLERLSGSRHEVLTGLCLWRVSDSVCLSTVETTTLSMRPWSPDERTAYLESGAWQGKSGAYAIREANDPFVEQMVGSVTNVIGLPLERLQQLLREFPRLLDPRAGAAYDT